MASGEAGAFGALLRRYRRAAALSQEALAERAGLSATTVSALERGARRAPYLGTVEVLATALSLGAADRVALLAAARPAGDHTAPFSADALVPLVGRERELALLSRFLIGEREPLGSAAVLLLAGEPGIGKTRLLQAAAKQAVARGWCVLVGGCQRRGSQEPFAPLLNALAQHLEAMGPIQRHAALSGCAWLVRLLPELAGTLEPLPAVTLAPEQERRLIHAAVTHLLQNVSGQAGTLLVLDDLQWAGPDALDVIHTLARAPRTPVRIVGAYRDTEVRAADPLGLLLADLAQARLVRQHTLRPLAPEEAADLLGNLLTDLSEAHRGQVERVLRRAGGTPFFLVSYAQALRQGGVDEVPWDLAQGVRQRVALLPAAGQALLGGAAVAGRRTSRDVLAAVVGQPEEAVLAGLEAACGARLLLEDDDAYVFAHDLIREVVEADLGAARRAALHRRVAEALEGSSGGASPELLAYHYSRGSIPDRAAPYLEQAGDHAWDQRAHGAAEGHYREALERLERVGRVHDALRVREKLGEVLHGAGRYDAALEVLERAAETYGVGGDLEGLVRVTAAMGWAHSLRGTMLTGIALITALLERLDAGVATPPPLATLYEALGWLQFTAGRYDASLAAGERAAALARAHGDDRTLARAEAHRINLLQMLGRLRDALRVGQEVLPLAQRVGDLTCLVGAHCDMAYIHALQGAFATSRRSLDRALAWAEQAGNPARLAFTLAMRSWIAALSGEWTGAHADLDRAAAVSSQTGRSWFSAYLPIFRARLSVAEGAWTTASVATQEALTLAEASGDLQALRWASTTMAEIDILEGRAEAARARLLPLLDRPGLEEGDVTSLLPVLAWAGLELGQVDEAAATVEQALARARPEGMRLVLVEALRVKALSAQRRGQWDEAARGLEEGLALARDMPYPYAEGRLLQVYGALHAQTGEPEAARERLKAARAIFARLGARMDSERVEARAGLSQKPATGEPGLTDAQWAKIAALLPPRRQGRGRPRADDRRTLEAILYVQRTGCIWAELPGALGDEATAHRRWQEWRAADLWERIAVIARSPLPAIEDERMAEIGAAASMERG